MEHNLARATVHMYINSCCLRVRHALNYAGIIFGITGSCGLRAYSAGIIGASVGMIGVLIIICDAACAVRVNVISRTCVCTCTLLHSYCWIDRIVECSSIAGAPTSRCG